MIKNRIKMNKVKISHISQIVKINKNGLSYNSCRNYPNHNKKIKIIHQSYMIMIKGRNNCYYLIENLIQIYYLRTKIT